MTSSVRMIASVAFAGFVLGIGGLLMAAPVPKAEAEPKWKVEFDRMYSLREGELVRSIPKPHPECRREFIADRLTRVDRTPPQDLKNAVAAEEMLPQVFRIDDEGRRGSPSQLHGESMPVAEGSVRPPVVGVCVLDSLWNLAEFYEYEIVVDPRYASHPDLRIDFPDIVVRRDAPREDLIRAFDAQLHEYCKTKFRLKIEMTERDVWVASGKFASTPRLWRQPGQVDVYEDEKHVNKKPYSRETCTEYCSRVDPKNFLRLLGGHMQTFVVWTDDRPPTEPTVVCDFHWASQLFQGIPPTNRDPAKVLINVGEQTGLKFEPAKRKVPILTITPR